MIQLENERIFSGSITQSWCGLGPDLTGTQVFSGVSLCSKVAGDRNLIVFSFIFCFIHYRPPQLQSILTIVTAGDLGIWHQVQGHWAGTFFSAFLNKA